MTSPRVPAPGTRLLTRRQGLGLLACSVPLGLLAACSEAEMTAPPTTTPGATPAPDLAMQAAAEESALIALYDAAIAALPAGDSRSLLTTIRAEHEQHRSALQPSAGSSSVPVTDGVGSGDVGISTLMDAERAAVKGRIRDCTEAPDPDLARLLAFIGASEAGHVAALGSLS